MKGPYSIIRITKLSQPGEAITIQTGIRTLSEAQKELTREHRKDAYYEYLLTNGSGEAIRWRYKNGAASYTTKTISAEPYFQQCVNAATNHRGDHTMTDTRKQLQDSVNRIADEITNADPAAEWWTEYQEYNDDDSDEPHGYAYIHDALDLEHTINGRGDHIGSRIAVALGGPNIFIDTRHNRVEGYWGTDAAYASYTDNLGVDDAAEEMYSLTK